MSTERFISFREARALLGVSRSYLYDRVRRGRLPSFRLDGRRTLRLRESDVLSLVCPDQAQAARPATAAATPKAVGSAPPNSTPPSADLTLRQAAASLGCEPALLEEAVRRGLLKARREGGEFWLRRAEVEALAEGDGDPGADPGGRGRPAHPRPSSRP